MYILSGQNNIYILKSELNLKRYSIVYGDHGIKQR